MKRSSLAAALVLLPLLACGREAGDRVPAPAAREPAAAPVDTALQRRLEAIAAAAPGRCGIAALHLGSGLAAGAGADQRVQLMSVCKLPIAALALHHVDRGTWTLERRVRLRPRDLTPGVSVLTERFPRGGEARIGELVDLALRLSDNSASDVLLRLVGGPRAMTAWLASHGLDEIRIDRSEREIGNDWYGLDDLPPESTWTAARIARWRAAVPAAAREAAAAAFARDPRDTGTPAALVRLLALLRSGRVLSPAMADTLEATMARCATGPGRLPGRLPPGTRVARKTGTSGTRGGVTIAVNDAGVIRLPGGGEAAVAVMVAEVRGPASAAEPTIAAAARAVFDAWSGR